MVINCCFSKVGITASPAPSYTCLKIVVVVSGILTLISAYVLAGHFFASITTPTISKIPLLYSALALSLSLVTFSVSVALLLCRMAKVHSANMPNPQATPSASEKDIPDDVWLEIFSKLEPESFIRLPYVCKRFRALAATPALTKAYNLALASQMMRKHKDQVLSGHHTPFLCQGLQQLGFAKPAQDKAEALQNPQKAEALCHILIAKIEKKRCDALDVQTVVNACKGLEGLGEILDSLFEVLWSNQRYEDAAYVMNNLWDAMNEKSQKFRSIAKHDLDKALQLYRNRVSTHPSSQEREIVEALVIACIEGERFETAREWIEPELMRNEVHQIWLTLLPKICDAALRKNATQLAQVVVDCMVLQIEPVHDLHLWLANIEKCVESCCAFALHLHRLDKSQLARSLIQKIKGEVDRIAGLVCAIAKAEYILCSPQEAEATLTQLLSAFPPATDVRDWQDLNLSARVRIMETMHHLGMSERAEKLYTEITQEAEFRRERRIAQLQRDLTSHELLVLLKAAHCLQKKERVHALLQRAYEELQRFPFLDVDEIISWQLRHGYTYVLQGLLRDADDAVQSVPIYKGKHLGMVLDFHIERKDYEKARKLLHTHLSTLRSADETGVAKYIIAIALHFALTDHAKARETIDLMRHWPDSKIHGLLSLVIGRYYK